MPELPEAETIVRGLRPHLPGQAIRKVEVLHDDLIRGATSAFVRDLSGGRLEGVERRGKNLVLSVARESEASPGAGADRRLVVNLGMSGRLLLLLPGGAGEAPTHPGVRFHLEGGGVLVYHDIRRFGRLEVFDPPAYREWSRGLGPDPLGRGFTSRRLEKDLGASVSPVRSWLLDQRRIAGVGNIYANEALFLARIHPRTPAARISGEGARRLHRALRQVLREAIRARGTTLRDYRTAAGDQGSYGGNLRVYGREGRRCPRCGAPVERIVFGNRSAFLCPRCQPEGSP